MIKNNIIVICVLLLLTNCTAQKKDTLINVHLKNYQQYASKYIAGKYTEVSKISDSILQKYEKSLVSYNYKKEQLSMYSCPIFNFKTENRNDSTIVDIIDVIDFTNHYEKQVITLYVGDTLISTHTVNAEYKTLEDWTEQFDEFNFFTNTLLLHENEFVMGLPLQATDIYAYKEQLEKQYFVFFIQGLETYFVFKNDAIYAVKMVCKEENANQESFEEFFKCLQPEFIEINEYFKEIKPVSINDVQVKKMINAFKKTQDVKHRKVKIQLKA